MGIFKTLFTFKESPNTELKAYEKWSVKWNSTSYCTSTFHDVAKECEFFTSKEDAELFAKRLREAFTLTRCVGDESVKVNKD